MATAVTMDGATKSKLEALQAEITLRTGRTVTQQEILGRVVDSAFGSRAEFVDSFRTAGSLSPEDVAAFNRGQISSGVQTDEADIDEILYG